MSTVGTLVLEWLRPIRLLGAIISAAVVLAAGTATSMLPGIAGGDVLLAGVVGGLMAFNTLLFFPPCGLALHPARFPPVLVVNVAPIPVVVLLYRVNPILADCVLFALAPGTVLARGRDATWGALATIGAINVLLPLLFGGAPGLAGLGAQAGVIGTIAAFLADAIATSLLRLAGLRTGARIVHGELARFVSDLAAAWRSRAPWPRARLWRHAERLQVLVAELSLAAQAARRSPPWPEESLPPAILLDAISRSTEVLHGTPDLPSEQREQIGSALDSLASARAFAEAGPAVESLRGLALASGPARDKPATTEFLGVALLLSDLSAASRMEGGLPVLAPKRTPPQPLEATAWRLAAQSALCMLLALLLMHVLPFPKPYWLPLTTFILVSASFGESARKSFDRILGTGAGLLTGQLVWMAAGGRTDVLTGVIGVSLVGMFSARNAPYRIMLFWLTVMLAMVLHLADAPLDFYAARLADTAIGIVLVLVITGFVLPVRTGEMARGRLRRLLTLAAARLRDIADALRAPGGHGVPGKLADLADSARALHDLAGAEELEDSLLRRPRGALAERQDAADRLIRVLIYLDQLVPILSGRRITAGTLAMLDAVVAAIQDIVRHFGGDGSPVPLRPLQAQAVAQEATLASLFSSGALDTAQLQAERRMVGTLALLLGALGHLGAAAGVSVDYA